MHGRTIINACCQQNGLKCMKEWSRGIKFWSFAASVMKMYMTQTPYNLKALPIVAHLHSCHLHEVPVQTSFRFLKAIMCILLDVLTQLPPDSCEADSETVCTAPLKPLILDPPPQKVQYTGLPSAALVPSSEVLTCSSLSDKLHYFFSHGRFIDSCHTWCGT